MAEDPEVPEESVEDQILAQLESQMPSALQEFAGAVHEMYCELKSVGFPANDLNQIIAEMLTNVATGRVFDEDYLDEDEWGDVDEGDIDNDGDGPK